jgi:hypothetical protein
LEFLHGKRGAAEDGEIQEPVKKPLYCAALEQDAAETLRGKVFEVKIAHDDPIVLEAIRDTTRHFLTRQTTGL